MREKYESLSSTVLKEYAKERKIKGYTKLKKSEIVEALLAQDALNAGKEKKEETKAKESAAAKENTAPRENSLIISSRVRTSRSPSGCQPRRRR